MPTTGNMPDDACDTKEETVAQVQGEEGNTYKNVRFYSKYSVVDGNKYFPVHKTADKLPPGCYTIGESNGYLYAEMIDYSDSELIRFPDTLADELIEEYNIFWGLKAQYEERGEQHKRGYLLHGPPGGGKTCLVKIMMQDFIKKGNIVFNFHPYLKTFLGQFRQIQPDKKIMITMEDIDTMLARNNYESEILEFLDGGTPLHDTVIIATTNYIERLPHRIKNRPSRFDRVSGIGFPTPTQRAIYFAEKSLQLHDGDSKMSKWVNDTENFSFAHLKELILGVEVYDKPYDEVLGRLVAMQKAEESSLEYEKKFKGESKMGFHHNAEATAEAPMPELKTSGRGF
jgi:hypothetical protein